MWRGINGELRQTTTIAGEIPATNFLQGESSLRLEKYCHYYRDMSFDL